MRGETPILSICRFTAHSILHRQWPILNNHRGQLREIDDDTAPKTKA